MVGTDKSVESREVPMIAGLPFLGLVHTDNLAGLIEAIQTAKDFKGKIIVMNNNQDREIIPTIRNDETWGQSLRYITKTVIRPTQPLTYAQSMNYFRELCVTNDLPYYFIMKEEASIPGFELRTLSERARILTMQNRKWGVMFTNGDALIAISRGLAEKVEWSLTTTPQMYYQKARELGFEMIETRLNIIINDKQSSL